MNISQTKPPLFYKTNNSIWTDPYIQNNLLAAHLDNNSDAASRNIESINTTVEFIHQQIKPNSEILDLGCGPGIYAKQLIEKHHHVTGVDFNLASINYAKEHIPNAQFIHTDYIKCFPAGRYDTIMMIYCDMGTHSDQERDQLLTHCYTALNFGGKLIFDVFNEQIVNTYEINKTWDYVESQGFWHSKPHLILKQTFHYPEAKVFANQYHIMSDEQTKQFIIWERYYSKTEIIQVLEKIGFKKITIHDGLLKSNNFTSNNEMFVIAEK